MKTTVIFHRADFDGVFCREIARKFLPDAELIGWDFGDPSIKLPAEGPIYIIDLPLDAGTGLTGEDSIVNALDRVIWIDHHKSSIERVAQMGLTVPGYRIDGVAACRLAWQWFAAMERRKEQTRSEKDAAWFIEHFPFPKKEDFIARGVSEPLAVRLAGEYDVWDHRDNAADVAFQFGLDAQESLDWKTLLDNTDLSASRMPSPSENYAARIIQDGCAAMQCYKTRDAEVMRSRSFLADFEGLKFLCLNTARCNSNTFNERDRPETGHDALLAFFWTGKEWSVSLYHAAHRKDLDLSEIAKRYGGGGHRGAAGFRVKPKEWTGFVNVCGLLHS